MAANMMRASDFVRLLPICEIGGVVRGHIGARVITTASAANHSYVRGLGADEVIDYNAQDFTKAASGCDAALDTVGADVA